MANHNPARPNPAPAPAPQADSNPTSEPPASLAQLQPLGPPAEQPGSISVTMDKVLDQIRAASGSVRTVDDVRDAEYDPRNSDLPIGLPEFMPNGMPIKYWWVYPENFSTHRYRDFLTPVRHDTIGGVPPALFNYGGIAIKRGTDILYFMDGRVYDKGHARELEVSRLRIEKMGAVRDSLRSDAAARMASRDHDPDSRVLATMSGGLYAEYSQVE